MLSPIFIIPLSARITHPGITTQFSPKTTLPYIEQFSNFDDDAVIVCNEEGKLKGLPLNRAIYGKDGKRIDIIAGDFLICRAPFDSDTYQSLTPEQLKKYELRFRYPEMFYRTFDGIRVIRQKERTHDAPER